MTYSSYEFKVSISFWLYLQTIEIICCWNCWMTYFSEDFSMKFSDDLTRCAVCCRKYLWFWDRQNSHFWKKVLVCQFYHSNFPILNVSHPRKTNITCDGTVLFSRQAISNWQEFTHYNLQFQPCLAIPWFQQTSHLLAHYRALFTSTWYLLFHFFKVLKIIKNRQFLALECSIGDLLVKLRFLT